MDKLLGLRAAAKYAFTILALRETELSVSELTQILKQSQPRVSRHLKLMVARDCSSAFGKVRGYFMLLGQATIALAKILVELVPEDDPIRLQDKEQLDAVARSYAAPRPPAKTLTVGLY